MRAVITAMLAAGARHLLALLVASCCCSPTFAASPSPVVQVVALATPTLEVGGHDAARWSIRTTREGRLHVDVMSPDGDTVKRLDLGDVAPGIHTAHWDGRDARNAVVPDEAWTVRAVLAHADGRDTDDPRLRSGGEVLTGLQPSITPDTDVAYVLPRAARVLIRVGIRGGAMLRSLAVWRPRPAGRNLQRWNGFDESGIVDLRDDRLALLVSAFALPDHSVITSGAPATPDYREWRLSSGWTEETEPSAETANRPLERNGVRIARQHHAPRYMDREPRVSIRLSDLDGKPLDPAEPLPGRVQIGVDLHPDDRWLMQEALYEVGIFVDGDFVSEAESGYVPIAWIWNTESLAAGQHRLSINVTGFTGRVGTKTLTVRK